MVQNINAQMNSYGSINKIGATENGRVIYQVIDGNGKEAGKMSIPQKDCDVFEKSYHDIMETAPKIQKFAEKHSTEESRKKLQKTSNLIIMLASALGIGIGIAKTAKLEQTWKQMLITAGTGLLGFAAGMGISFMTTTPSGMTKFNKATQTLSKLDIQKVE